MYNVLYICNNDKYSVWSFSSHFTEFCDGLSLVLKLVFLNSLVDMGIIC
jgi:hypothetical protein